ncbi:MAG: elongation factor P maturation arginine rhamnosyltransferase EarP [Candidatus Accumulibacter phosphatis]|jgi:uncharacterized repeat protein (TIGR03837 family)|nr:elongation factor P maturation arginine rhamnosyltransferase EarP [Candidatus Accumulibacter contiguus]
MTTRPDWDVFCKVIDNFGDIGVCWRLARQLANEYAASVRLWVDDLDSFRLLCPQRDPALSIECVQGVEVRRWESLFTAVTPARVVLESFACRIPENFVDRMAQLSPPPLWINLDYLSAEAWVSGCHLLPSPHAHLPLVKYFFFPGFTTDTGGLLRERDLRTRRRCFAASTDLQNDWWRALGSAAPRAGTLLVSLFAYENTAIGDLLHAWEVSGRPVCCLAPCSRTLPAIAAYAGRALAAGDRLQRGALEIRILPFVEQLRYDSLLWLCDLNFVRGEDSFVRAQWAARPLVWQIYPQQEAAHLIKLDAFLARYCAMLPQATAVVLCEFWQAWNAGRVETAQWQQLAASLPLLHEHALRWEARLAAQDDLVKQLVRFSASRL